MEKEKKKRKYVKKPRPIYCVVCDKHVTVEHYRKHIENVAFHLENGLGKHF